MTALTIDRNDAVGPLLAVVSGLVAAALLIAAAPVATATALVGGLTASILAILAWVLFLVGRSLRAALRDGGGSGERLVGRSGAA